MKKQSIKIIGEQKYDSVGVNTRFAIIYRPKDSSLDVKFERSFVIPYVDIKSSRDITSRMKIEREENALKVFKEFYQDFTN